MPTADSSEIVSSEIHEVDDYLRTAQESGASDLHLSVGLPPVQRRFGRLEPLGSGIPRLTAADTERLAMQFITNEEHKQQLLERGDTDFAYSTSFGRYRASVVRQRLGYEIVLRIINTTVRTMNELGLSESLRLLTQYQNGLILVTGAVGSGKSTTLAALMEEINISRRDHIITLEDPIEYIFESKGCQITQREVHTHTESFANALRAALREDPDVIMVGEMRDLETIQLAITASETGHLVLGTLHTSNTSRTIDRVLDVFPIDQREQIRMMVSESLRGVVSQQLIPRADGTGRVMAMEMLVNTPAVANCIREAKTFMLPGIIQTGRKLGMRLMDDALIELYDQKIISKEELLARGEQKDLIHKHLGIR